MMMYSLAVVHGRPCIPSLSLPINSHMGALLILTYAAVQVVYINTFHEIFVVHMLNFDKARR